MKPWPPAFWEQKNYEPLSYFWENISQAVAHLPTAPSLSHPHPVPCLQKEGALKDSSAATGRLAKTCPGESLLSGYSWGRWLSWDHSLPWTSTNPGQLQQHHSTAKTGKNKWEYLLPQRLRKMFGECEGLNVLVALEISPPKSIACKWFFPFLSIWVARKGEEILMIVLNFFPFNSAERDLQ